MTEWSIDAKSMASVKKQVDKIAMTSLTVTEVFAKIGGRLEPEIRKALNKNIQLRNAKSPHAGKIAGTGGLVSVVCKPTGRARFSVTIQPQSGSKKGAMLMAGRKGGGFIVPRGAKKALSIEKKSGARNPKHKFSGKAFKHVRSVSVRGRADEIHDVAEAVVKTQMRHQIAKRTGLGPLGGGSVTTGRLQ